MFRHLSVRLASLFRRERLERELDTELRYHIDMLVEQNIAQGMAPDAARREALRVFGTVDGRQGRRPRQLAVALRRSRGAGRPLRRAQPAPQSRASRSSSSSRWRSASAPTPPSSASSTACCCGRCPTRTATSWSSCTTARATPVANDLGFSPKEMDDYRQARSLSDVVEFHNMFFNLLGRAEPERLSTGVVSANYFDVLGVQPLHGRTFVRGRRRAGRAGGAGAEPQVLGAQLRRRSERRRPGVPDERQAAHGGRRPAAGAAVSARSRRLHAVVGVPVPLDAAARSTARQWPDADARSRASGPRSTLDEVAGRSRHRGGAAAEQLQGRLPADGLPRRRRPAEGRPDAQLHARRCGSCSARPGSCC